MYSTDDGGRTWARIYPHGAAKLVRTSARVGILATGDRVSRCGCRMVRLWTNDSGVTWHRTHKAAGGGFVASSAALWWWRGGRLYRSVTWPPSMGKLEARWVAHLPGVILEADAVPGGVLALVTSRVAGVGLDTSPRLLLVQGTRVSVLRLPRVGGDVLVSSLEAAWPSATVRGVPEPTL